MSGPYEKHAASHSAGRSGGAAGQVGGQSTTQQVTIPSATRTDRTRAARNESTSSSSSSNDHRGGAGYVGGAQGSAGYAGGVQGGAGYAGGAYGGPGFVGGAYGGAYGGSQATSSSYQQFPANSQQGAICFGVGYPAANEPVSSPVSGPRRQGRYQKQVIRLPDQQGQVRQVRRRVPTPEPDTLERVYIQRTGPEIVEEITEIPTTPPPRIQERTVVEPGGPPQVVKRVIRVPPRSGSFVGYQQQGAGFGVNFSQSGGNLLSAGSYGNVQQVTGGYQQPAGVSTGFAGYGTAAPNYGAASSGSVGGYGSTTGAYGAASGGYSQGFFGGGTSVAGPFPGIPPNAHCFYV